MDNYSCPAIIIAPAPKIITSCKKCINRAHPNPFVSITDFARNQPNNPAIITPDTPLGVPKKCGNPKTKADIQQIVSDLILPSNPATIANRLKISSDQAFARENRNTNGNSLINAALNHPFCAATVLDINNAVPAVKEIAITGP